MDQNTSADSLHIVAIVAGTNDPSNSNMLMDVMLEGIKSTGNVTVEKVHLKNLSIAHFNLSCYGESCPIDDLTHVESHIKKADAVIISTPLWNFGVPAHLKNLIDRMGSFALDASRSLGTLNGKPFYFILTAGMPASAWPFIKKTFSHVPYAIQYFGGSVLGTHFEGGCTLGRGEFGLVVDKRPRSLQSVQEKGVIFGNQVREYKRTGVLPLRYRLIKKFVRVSQLVKKRLGL